MRMKISIRWIIRPLTFLTTAILMGCAFVFALLFLPFVLYQELSDPIGRWKRRELWKRLKDEKKGGSHVDD